MTLNDVTRRPFFRRREAVVAVGAVIALLGAIMIGSSPAAVAAGKTAGTSPLGFTSTPAACNSANVAPGHVRCYADIANTPAPRNRASVTGPPATAMTPSQIQAAYHLAGAQGHPTVAIVDAYGYDAAESDLGVYRSQFGLSACTSGNGCFRKVDETGGTTYPVQDAGWSVETALDLDAVSAACPQCDLLLVQASSTATSDLGSAVDTAVRLGAKFVSNSYGIDGEFSAEPAADSHWNHPGVAVTVSAGDSGNVQSWPATDPNVIAVGGTRLTPAPSTTRGWTESAWDSGGSGCSLYEPQPSWQLSEVTACTRRATADISADADPESGLASYDSLTSRGWNQVGGTSLSSPLTAAMYALAGTPTANRYPVQDLYVNQGAGLNDVTTGTDASCGTVLCTAGVGWDGPTGFGTPNGTAGLVPATYGVVTGTALARGVAVSATQITLTNTAGAHYAAVTDAAGKYSVDALPGRYSVTSRSYGFTAPATTVQVRAGVTTTDDVTLTAVPSTTVSGTVTDASGHGWPLAASINIDGYPHGTIHSSSTTGRFTVSLPNDSTYHLHATADLSGYNVGDSTVTLGTKPTSTNIALTASNTTCSAPGYDYPAAESFDSWSGTAPLDGWTSSAGADAWQFGDTLNVGDGVSAPNSTGGSGSMASFIAQYPNTDAVATLTSPSVDLSTQKAPVVALSSFRTGTGENFTIQDSFDNGATWTEVGTPSVNQTSTGIRSVFALPNAAGHSNVRVRFTAVVPAGLTGAIELDDIGIGQCSALPGGLLDGIVSDGNTEKAISAAQVATPAGTVTTDSAGHFTLFANLPSQDVTVSADRFTTKTVRPRVLANAVTPLNVSLATGHLQVSTAELDPRGELGSSSTQTITLTNRGTAPLAVAVQKQSGNFVGQGGSDTSTAWTSLTDLPQPVMDNTVGSYSGRTYTVGGTTDATSPHTWVHSYVYSPATKAWKRISDPPTHITLATGAFIGNTFYVIGGIGPDPADPNTVAPTVATAWAYHVNTDRWTSIAALPSARAFASSTVLNGALYVIGGCTGATCAGTSQVVYRYNPTKNVWQTLANLPQSVIGTQCAALASEILCAGGGGGSKTAAYTFNPASNRWNQIADMPGPVYLGQATGANGEVQILGTNDDTNTPVAYQYDPVMGHWSNLATPLEARLRFGATCGITSVGGSAPLTFLSLPSGTADAETLAGNSACGGDPVSWLSTDLNPIHLAPGASKTISVSVDSASLTQPGVYTARLNFLTDSAEPGESIQTRYTVTAPATWGQISGTVTDAASGRPLGGAAVQV